MQWLAVDELFPHFRGSLFAVGEAEDVSQYLLLAWAAGWSAICLGRFRDLGRNQGGCGSSVLPLKRPFTCEPP